MTTIWKAPIISWTADAQTFAIGVPPTVLDQVGGITTGSKISVFLHDLHRVFGRTIVTILKGI